MTDVRQLLAPFTFKVGFLEAPFQTVGDAMHTWRKQHVAEVTISSVEAELTDALCTLEPLTIPPNRELLLATTSDWTAYFDNGIHGADPFGPISYLAEQLGCRGLIATDIPHTLDSEVGDAKGTYGAIQFELFGPRKRRFLNYERSVSLSYEGGKWTFEANGTVQPFENVDAYRRKRVRDRFSSEMLEEYCYALDLQPFHSQFYARSGMLLRLETPRPRRQLTLAEARQELGVE